MDQLPALRLAAGCIVPGVSTSFRRNLMQAEQSLKDGDIQLALSQLQEQVRSNPASVEYRIFLFQLLSVQGEWGMQ